MTASLNRWRNTFQTNDLFKNNQFLEQNWYNLVDMTTLVPIYIDEAISNGEKRKRRRENRDFRAVDDIQNRKKISHWKRIDAD